MRYLSAPYLTPDDLEEFVEDASQTKRQGAIDDVFAQAIQAAPSLGDSGVVLTEAQQALVKSILRQACISYLSTSANNLTSVQESAGPFSRTETHDTRAQRYGLLTRNQKRQLEDLHREVTSTVRDRAHLIEVDLLPADWGRHRNTSDMWW